mmetsp:Transcript_35180/g.73884  ORF Transcript_35180/g.73884 Transcript_35180/m.73884 type:complete len:267 (+) Transcript_35180:3572-4372(+)
MARAAAAAATCGSRSIPIRRSSGGLRVCGGARPAAAAMAPEDCSRSCVRFRFWFRSRLFRGAVPGAGSGSTCPHRCLPRRSIAPRSGRSTPGLSGGSHRPFEPSARWPPPEPSLPRCRCRCRCRRRGLLCHIGHHRPGVVPVVLGLFETVQKRRSVQIVEGREGLVELDPSLVVVAVAVAAGGTRCGRALPDGRGGGDQFFLDDGEGLFEVVGVEQLFREDVALGVFRGPVGGSHGGGCRSRSGRWRRRHRRGRRGRVLGAVFVAR